MQPQKSVSVDESLPYFVKLWFFQSTSRFYHREGRLRYKRAENLYTQLS